ncbi:hypothetical protein TIFTF001_008494 [Ficus carica]|uniref:Uncharacterized protein n=1 Tax=Ficus carica TaxID=3494 RepID=A0AA88AF59_FICCA|nr:hypothetical protein TIFTF001_008494 [Ficus carica]
MNVSDQYSVVAGSIYICNGVVNNSMVFSLSRGQGSSGGNLGSQLYEIALVILNPTLTTLLEAPSSIIQNCY